MFTKKEAVERAWGASLARAGNEFFLVCIAGLPPPIETVAGLPTSVDVSAGTVRLRCSAHYRSAFQVTDHGVHATLSFGGRNADLYISWNALLGIRQGGVEIGWQSAYSVSAEPTPAPKRGLRLVGNDETAEA